MMFYWWLAKGLFLLWGHFNQLCRPHHRSAQLETLKMWYFVISWKRCLYFIFFFHSFEYKKKMLGKLYYLFILWKFLSFQLVSRRIPPIRPTTLQTESLLPVPLSTYNRKYQLQQIAIWIELEKIFYFIW